MRSLSSLYKWNTQGHYTRVIDNNEILEQKLTAIALEQQQLAEKAAKEAAFARMLKQQENGEITEEDMALQLDALTDDLGIDPEMQVDYVEHAKEEATRIVAQATKDAEEILQRAAKEAASLKESAEQEAMEQGYSAGRQQAEEEAARMRQELDTQRMQLENEYQERLEKMEPELMRVVIQVFDKVFGIEFGGKQDILLHLIQNTVQQIKNSREYRIRVSAEDYAFVYDKKEDIQQRVGGDIIMDVISDEELQQGQCTIDTDEGIFDCSMDVELDNLVRDLKALSMMG